MEIISHEINKDNISLVTTSPVARLVLYYGDRTFTESLTLIIQSADFSITKEELGLDTLDNRYFKIDLLDDTHAIRESVGMYNINIENNNETPLYNAAVFKQELDNLNYYSGILYSLNEKKAFQEANDFFFNYKQFLEKKLNGNNILQIVSGQQATNPGSNRGQCSN